MILTLGATKGGVGKSTLALNIAITLARRGRDVWLVDGDRQATSQTAIGVRAAAGITPGIACSRYENGILLRNQVKQQADKFDDVIIDVGGRDNTGLRAAMMVCDVLLVPFNPYSVDLWALADIAALIDEAKESRDDLIVYSVLNMAEAAENSQDNQAAIEAMAEYGQMRYLDVLVRDRKAFSNGVGQGLAVNELPRKRRDKKAESELERLIDAIW